MASKTHFGVEIPKHVMFSKVEFPSQINLMKEFPPKLFSKNKVLLKELWSEQPSSSVPERDRSISFSRWTEWPLPKEYDKSVAEKMEIILRTGAYDYQPYAKNGVEWHVNFADKILFGFYGGALFAQDEMQVAEHPVLASIKEALTKNLKVTSGTQEFLLPLTRSDSNAPTPCLIRGAERRLRVAVDPNPEEGRPYGLYGNSFAKGSEEAIRKATTVFEPLSLFTNIIAMEAPKGGRGTYTQSTIKEVLSTVYTSAMAARAESSTDGKAYVVIHTGHWGTGAFGGNRILLAALQIIGMRLAGIDAMVFHGFDDLRSVEEAITLIDKLTAKKRLSIGELFIALEKEQFRWGQSDGN